MISQTAGVVSLAVHITASGVNDTDASAAVTASSLAVCRQIVARAGGSLGIHHEPGKQTAWILMNFRPATLQVELQPPELLHNRTCLVLASNPAVLHMVTCKALLLRLRPMEASRL